MSFNLLTIFSITAMGLVFTKLFKNNRLLTICIIILSVLSVLKIDANISLTVTLMIIFLLMINYKSFILTNFLILSYVLQSVLLLSFVFSSVNYWETKDLLAVSTAQILRLLLLLTMTFLIIKYHESINKYCSAFSMKEKLFLSSLAWVLIPAIIFSGRMHLFLDIYWAIYAFIAFFLGQFFCFYLFYFIEIHTVKETDKIYALQAASAYENEIHELLTMKTEIARTYHELDTIKMLKDYYENSFIPIKEGVNTQNNVLNYMLNQGIDQLHKDGFQLKLTINFSDYPLTETETASLFKNLFKNICQHASHDHVVDLKIIEVKKLFVIICSNGFNPHASSSENNWQHGYGHSVMNEIADSHGGHIDIQQDSYKYTLKIIIPLFNP
ncbi:GHKL domain-containing protein [Dielma fastidiosa]|uniref:ATP-binding protein n=1 Tax=Dielma fastidiosa TaxID=1034346 RepID=A0AB35UU59_9FIRM|nr:GHKL domain-containing protein [Dielma fastidiosa]MDY5169001.1 ATP-binding protein [Dielma fastidiosa]